MGLKDFFIRKEGSRYKNMEWLKRNKTWVGLIFSLFGVYVWQYSCPGLELYCSKVGPLLTNLGTFLTGAGVLDSDTRQKFVQGVISKPNVD